MLILTGVIFPQVASSVLCTSLTLSLLTSRSAFGCPYSDMNTKKEVTLPDRLGGEKQITFVPVHFVQKTKRLGDGDEGQKPEESHVETRCERNALAVFTGRD